MDKRTLEISRWGRHWVAQLRVTPTDGSFSEGYVVTHDRILGGKRGIAAVRKRAEALGIECQVLS